MRKPTLTVLLFLASVTRATNQEEWRDILLGASHAINHAPAIQTGDDSAYYSAGSDNTATRQNRRVRPEKRVSSTRQQQRKTQEEIRNSIRYGNVQHESNGSSRANQQQQTRQKKFVSSSFGLIANTLGFAADTLRISGDTASGLLGSSIKLVGTAVKSTGSQFDNAGNWISPKKKSNNKYLLASSWHKPASRKTWNGSKRRDKLIHGSRSMAARSVKLMGNVVRELGDVLVFTGAATESIGSLTAAVAEDSLRILEDFAGSIADNAPPAKARILVRPLRDPVAEEPTISYGTYEPPASDFAESVIDGEKGAGTIMETAFSILAFINEGTGGVPSQAPELFVVFALCYLGAALTFGNKAVTAKRKIVIKQEVVAFTWGRVLFALLLLPLRFAYAVLKWVVGVIFSRYTLLLLCYLLAWLHVCNMSQIRSKSIYSSAESQGYRFALSSLQAVNPSMQEPAVWLNTLLQQIWRVPSSECPHYPDYVRDGMHGCNQDPVNCIDGTCDSSYGGLEPFLAWTIGDALTAALESSRISRPRNVAYASLHSISLGSLPPLIRHVQILDRSNDGRHTDFLIEFDMSLEDLRMVLEIKLSSLEYALLPTTKIAVGSLVSNVKLKVRTSTIPESPFLSKIHLSLAHLPDSSVRITPLGDESGLKGIDIGSLPLIREWIQGSIRKFLSTYVSPKYVSIDLQSWSQPQPGIDHAAPPLPFQKSKSRRPRRPGRQSAGLFGGQDLLKAASSQSPIISTLDDTDNGDTIVQQDQQPAAPFPRLSLIKPKTQIAQLGMDRWMEFMKDEEHTAGNGRTVVAEHES